MIVYIKNSNGVRQLEYIDDVVLDKEKNAILGYFDYPKIQNNISFTINFEGEYNENVEKCYRKIKQALDEHKDSVLIHIYNEGVMIE